MGLGGADTAQDQDALSYELEEFIDGSGELNEEVIVVDGEGEEIQGPDKPIQEEVMPDQGAQQPDLPV